MSLASFASTLWVCCATCCVTTPLCHHLGHVTTSCHVSYPAGSHTFSTTVVVVRVLRLLVVSRATAVDACLPHCRRAAVSLPLSPVVIATTSPLPLTALQSWSTRCQCQCAAASRFDHHCRPYATLIAAASLHFACLHSAVSGLRLTRQGKMSFCPSTRDGSLSSNLNIEIPMLRLHPLGGAADDLKP